MSRIRDRGEIYLISLDTFMIVAVMGITLGLLFIVINPTAKLYSREQGGVDESIGRISKDSLESFTSKLTKIGTLKDIKLERKSLWDGDVLDFLDGTSSDDHQVTVKRMMKVGNEFTELNVVFQKGSDGVYEVKITYKDAKRDIFKWNSTDDPEAEENAMILQQIREWKELDNILF